MSFDTQHEAEQAEEQDQEQNALEKAQANEAGGGPPPPPPDGPPAPPPGNAKNPLLASVPTTSAISEQDAASDSGLLADWAPSSGSALPDSTREVMESHLGADLSSVKVHTSGEAAAAADGLAARAFTVGSDVHFGAGEYAPGTKEGDRLLAHELTHVVQGQGQGGAQLKAEATEVSHPHDPAEVEADGIADDIAAAIHDGVEAPGPIEPKVATQKISRAVIHREEKSASAAPTEASSTTAPIGTPATPATPAHELTKEEKEMLSAAEQTTKADHQALEKAKAQLTQYAAAATSLIDNIQQTSLATAQKYKKQFDHVNEVISHAKEVSALQSEVLGMLAAAALGPIADELGKQYEELTAVKACTSESVQGIEELSSELEVAETVGEMKTGMKELAADAKEQGSGLNEAASHSADAGGSSTDGLEDPALKELAIWQQLAQLQSVSGELLPVALQLATCGEVLGALGQKIADQHGAQSDPKFPVSKMRKLSLDAWSALQPVLSGAETATSALTNLRQLLAAAKEADARPDSEIEADLWTKWIAGLDGSNVDEMSYGVIEDYFKKHGLWDKLGVDPSFSFGDKKESVAVLSARAQEKVMAHVGESVPMTGDQMDFPGGGTFIPVQLDGMGFPLPGRMDDGAWVAGGQAIVIGARATAAIDESVLESSIDNENRVDFLLKQGHITVLLQAHKATAAEAAPTDAP